MSPKRKKQIAFATHKVSNSNKDSEEYPNQIKWKGLFRGSLLSTTINKHVSYVGFSDRRAQGIITINALLIPIALSGSQNPLFQMGSIITIFTAVLSICSSFISLYPKKYGHKTHSHQDLLHFSQIQKLSENQYLELMRKALVDTSTLAEMAARDLYHLSKRVLGPKFFWLKISYFIFLIGNLIAIGTITVQTWS